MKELFRKTIESAVSVDTILVVEVRDHFREIVKREFKRAYSPRYDYYSGEYTAYSDIDVDIMEAPKYLLGDGDADVPEDFWFDHP